jgi:serine/threonine protein kinase/WD40 repeat protein/Tfp pilus assembly protein PilF
VRALKRLKQILADMPDGLEASEMAVSQSDKDDLIDRLAEEIAKRFRKGERPTLAEYLEQYPDLADEIRELLPALFELEQVKDDAAEEGVSSAPTSPIPTSVGDYLILREIGRGGMGVVYEAQQLSLGRRVALKLLPHQKFRDARHRLRFEREARAAARLHHTNIVPVFGVGEHDGQPYYSMQFIHGLGLDEVINELRRLKSGASSGAASANRQKPGSPKDLSAADMARSMFTGGLASFAADATIAGPAAAAKPPRELEVAASPSPNPALTPSATKLSDIFTVSSSDGSATPQLVSSTSSASRRSSYWHCVARIGRQVADALDYAHKQGILHRDIKPSNLLLDTREIVWVTDFGLAKIASSDGDAGENLTHTGDLLGTLRYMPPEAFDGKSDAQGDLYSLGLTLYEMLAFRPAFDERERSRLIKQVTLAEPARLERLSPGIPADLATIVHKAIQGDAKDRYASASELAADLRRFLDDQPIHARRISAVERLYRWCYRNPMVAALSTAVVVLVAIVGTGTWLATMLRLERDRALASQQRAEIAERENQIRAHLASATAYRRSGRPGQQVKALEEIRKALDLDPSMELKQELRNEAIAAMVLPDLQVDREWEGFPVGTSGFAFDPEFERYARGDSIAGKVGVYRVSDNQLLQSLEGAGPVSGWRGLEFSPDGRFLHQVCELDNRGTRLRSRLWKLDGPKPVAIVDDEHGLCAFEPQGSRCALAYPDQTVRLVDLESGKEIKRIGHSLGAYLNLLAWNPRYPLLAVSSPNACRVFDVDNGEVGADMPETGNIDWHPDGKIVAVCARDSKVYLLDYRTGKVVLPPLELGAGGAVCRFDHAGSWLLSNDWSNLSRVWDSRTGRQLLAFEGGNLNQVFSRDDALLGPFAIGNKLQLLRCFAGKGLQSRTSPFEGLANACVDESARWLAVSSRQGTTLIDLARESEPVLLPERGNYPLRFDGPDHSLWTFGSNGLLRWPIRRGGVDSDMVRVGPAEQVGTSGEGGLLGASKDGTVIAYPRHSQGALAWHRPTNKTVALEPQDDVRSCAVSPDGRWVATGSHWLRQGGGAKIWDAATGKQVAELPVRGECAVHFSPAGKWLVTCSSGNRLWEVGTWREGPSLVGSSFSYQCAFTVDDGLLALPGEPGTIRLVIPDTGQEIVRLTNPHATRHLPLCFTQDGSQLTALGADSKDLYLFDLRAIRKELQALNLDWDAPPLPPVTESPAKPVRWVVETADFLRINEANRLTGQAAQFAAEKKFGQALDALRQAVHTDPGHAMASNSLAWLLMTGPKELRDPNAALPLARKAVELEPKQPRYYNTLGIALYRTGAFKEAIPVLEKSLEMGKGTADAFDLFFLAMCHQRLGEARKAKDCYDRALKWLEVQRAKLSAAWAAELTEFQAEARSLLFAARRLAQEVTGRFIHGPAVPYTNPKRQRGVSRSGICLFLPLRPDPKLFRAIQIFPVPLSSCRGGINA